MIRIQWFLRWTVDSAFCKWLNNRLGEYVFSVEYARSRLQCKHKRVDTEFPLTYTWVAERSEHARFIYNASVREKNATLWFDWLEMIGFIDISARYVLQFCM